MTITIDSINTPPACSAQPVVASDALKPIIVTGMYRSGTTWVGRMLALSPRVCYFHEPMHPNFYINQHLWRTPLKRFNHYVHNANCDPVRAMFDQVFGLRFDLMHAMRSAGSTREALSYARRRLMMAACRARRGVALVKDPSALYATPWLAEQYNANVVIVVRHPAAVAHSMSRTHRGAVFTDLLAQPRLMADFHPGMEHAMRRADAGDILDRAALAWTVANQVVADYREKYPSWTFVRHEDLARDPQTGFDTLYRRLGIRSTARMRRALDEHTNKSNPAAAPNNEFLHLKRDSEATTRRWKSFFSPQQIDRLRTAVEPLASTFYSDEDWS